MTRIASLVQTCNIIFGLLLCVVPVLPVWAGTSTAVQDRIDADVAAGQPVVVHLIVALCDNVNQGIVPVPAALGNGQDPKSNLYWGALYGVRTHLGKTAGWKALDTAAPDNQPILERVVFRASVKRNGHVAPVYVVADAWDGVHIREAMVSYFEMAAGRSGVLVDATGETAPVRLRAGGSAHLIAFVGHDGLMDFSLDLPKAPVADAPPRSALALSCASKSYFLDHLNAAGAQPVLLTTGLMAPEAYTLDAALRAWAGTGTTESVVEASAQAYNRYQKCGIKGARRLFWGGP